jgi:hypothetical protein
MLKGSERMEEQQIQDFVHQVMLDQTLRQELIRDPRLLIGRADLSPRVARVLLRLLPHVAFEEPLNAAGRWWHV